MLKNFFQNTCKPQGRSGRLMIHMMNKGHGALASWGFSHISPEPGWDALDIGCGGGANLAALLNLLHRGTATGLDYSPLCVEQSITRNREAIHAGRCRVLQGDASALPFDTDSFDLVTAFETVYFWPKPDSSFQQVYHTLRPGGVFLICNEACDPSDDRWSKLIDGMKIYSKEELEHFLAEAGFGNITFHVNEKRGWLCLTAKKEISSSR